MRHRNTYPLVGEAMHGQVDKQWACIELPTLEYTKVRDLQVQLVSKKKDGSIDTSVVLILEHSPVFTLGRRGGSKNLMVSEGFLRKAAIPVIHVERGGDITFHGPGQLIMYPIIDLRSANMSVADYVKSLEEAMIRTAEQWGIKAYRNPVNRGAWVNNNKLGSIGIAIRHGITFHGLALNVDISLQPFNWIHPCGLRGVSVTSMEKELSRKVCMSDVRETMKRQFEAVFGIELAMTKLSEIQGTGNAHTEATLVETASASRSNI